MPSGFNKDIESAAMGVKAPVGGGNSAVSSIASSTSSQGLLVPDDMRGRYCTVQSIDCVANILFFTGSASTLTFRGTTSNLTGQSYTVGWEIPVSGTLSFVIPKDVCSASIICNAAGGRVQFQKSQFDPGER